jgi:hypothetical protein
MRLVGRQRDAVRDGIVERPAQLAVVRLILRGG